MFRLSNARDLGYPLLVLNTVPSQTPFNLITRHVSLGKPLHCSRPRFLIYKTIGLQKMTSKGPSRSTLVLNKMRHFADPPREGTRETSSHRTALEVPRASQGGYRGDAAREVEVRWNAILPHPSHSGKPLDLGKTFDKQQPQPTFYLFPLSRQKALSGSSLPEC